MILAATAGMLALTWSVRADDDDFAQVSFTKDIAPIFQAKCVECHRTGDIGPMALSTWEDSRPWAKSIKKAVESKTMPPFHAVKGEYPYRNDNTLTPEEIALVGKWVEAGAPQGDPADMPAQRQFDDSGWRTGKPDLVLQPTADYMLGADVIDEYRCYVFQSNLPEDTWVGAIEYRPGDRRVVHHIMAYAEPTGVVRPKDEATPEPGYICGMNGDTGSQRLDMLLGGWAPGTPPNVFREGSGRLLPKGTDIVFQVHYHNTTGQEVPDRSSMGIYFARGPIKKMDRISLVGSMKLNIPAGEGNAQHFATWVAPYDITLNSVMPHMHYLGKMMKVDAVFPDGRRSTLVDVPRFDFNWQIVYAYTDPLKIPKGTKLEMTSSHDNSANNAANPSKPPKDVTWGEATDEEMAHCWLNFTKDSENLNVIANPPVLAAK